MAYGAAVLLPNGNGLIAVFVAAIVLGIRRPDMREAFADQSLDIVEIVKLGDLRGVRVAADVRRPVARRVGRIGVAMVTFVVARPVAVM